MARHPKLEIFPGTPINGKRWYWHLKAANGKIVADGCQPYGARSKAIRAAMFTHIAMKAAILKCRE